jgi:hypothetical protein
LPVYPLFQRLCEANVTTQELTIRSGHRLLAVLCILLAILQLADLHSSLLAASLGRTETNPAIVWLIAKVGFVPAVLCFKAGALLLLWIYFRAVSGFERVTLPVITMAPVCAAYFLVVVNNYS